MLEQIINDLKETRKTAKQRLKEVEENRSQIEAVEAALKDVHGFSSASYDYEINASYYGDFTTLKAIFTALRNLGYEPNERPGKTKLSYFNTSFSKDDWVSVRISYSSTVCKRVKIGTKMVEQDVYEVTCE